MRKIRVLVIDDSAYNRRTISRLLEGLPEIEVIGSARDGAEGLRLALELKPDLITLDLEMPTMEGFTFLRLLMNRQPTPVLVVSSQGEGDRVLQALELGASDCVLKPGALASPSLKEIGDDLCRKVQALARLTLPGPVFTTPPALPLSVPAVPHDILGGGIDVIVVGASTGGPAALKSILTSFPAPPSVAILVAQHMPACFTRAFAERLNRLCPYQVSEAQDGDEVQPGRVLIAPGGQQMTVTCRDGRVVATLAPMGTHDRYVPSVDLLFASCASLFGSRLLGVILTGMGNDGVAGVRAVKESGGQVIVESEETAVVFGMPREAIAAGVVDRVVRLEKMAYEITRRCGLVPETTADAGRS